jgi:hypothetical protein
MSRLVRVGNGLLLVALACVAVPEAQQPSSDRALKPQPAAGRTLRIEDYYRVQTLGNTSFSPNSKWVTFTVTTRLDEPEANSNRIDSWLVPSDGSAEPRRVQHQGKDVSNPSWASEEDGWLHYTVDGQRWKIDPDSQSTAPVQIAGGGPESAGRGGRGGRGGGRGGESSAPSPDGKTIGSIRR